MYKTLVLPIVLLSSLLTIQEGSAHAQSAVNRSSTNTLTFNHLSLMADVTSPYVLAVGHGEYFQIVFTNTDPRFFDYSISAITDESPKDVKLGGSETAVAADARHTTAVTMRHDRHIQKYTVAISAKTNATVKAKTGGRLTETESTRPTDLPDTLYPISFDVWVRTSEWTVAFNGGFGFSNLTSDKFFIQTDTKGTASTEDDVKTVKKATSGKDQFRPDLVAFANVSHTDRFRGLGLAFGVGIGESSDARYFFGPSWTFGKNFVFTGGWTGGKVNTLPTGQEEDKPPIAGDNTLNTLGTRFRHGFFLGLGFTFSDKKDDFLAALGAATKSKAEGDKKGSGENAAADAADSEAEDAIEASTLRGTYASRDGKQKAVVTVEDGVVSLALNSKPPVKLTAGKGTHFSIPTVANSDVHFVLDKSDKRKIASLTYSAGADRFAAVKQP